MGARSIKTLLAIIISLLIAEFFGLNYILVTVGAMNGVSKYLFQTIRDTKEYLIANIIAIFLSIIVFILFGNSLIVILFTIIIFSSLISFFNRNNYFTIGTIAIVAILSIPEPTLETTFLRIAALLVGFFVADLINFLIFKPRYLIFTHKRIISARKNCLSLFDSKEELSNKKFNTKVMRLNEEISSFGTFTGYFLKEASSQKKNNHHNYLINILNFNLLYSISNAFTNNIFIINNLRKNHYRDNSYNEFFGMINDNMIELNDIFIHLTDDIFTACHIQEDKIDVIEKRILDFNVDCSDANNEKVKGLVLEYISCLREIDKIICKKNREAIK